MSECPNCYWKNVEPGACPNCNTVPTAGQIEEIGAMIAANGARDHLIHVDEMVDHSADAGDMVEGDGA